MTATLKDPQAMVRYQQREDAIAALMVLDPHDAAAIATTVLDEVSAGYPPYDAFGDIRAAASWWVDFANPAELEIYFAAILRRLPDQALGLRARKRLITLLFKSLKETVRRSFLAWAERHG
jgi:hypothetical protein